MRTWQIIDKLETICGFEYVASLKIWKRKKKKVVIFKAKRFVEKNYLALDGRVLLNWMSRILVITVCIMLNWESDKRDILIKVMNL